MKQAANIAAVAELEPDYMGFIFYQKSPRFISEISSELIKYVPPSIKTTGVFVNEELNTVKSHVIKYGLKAVQLHGAESVSYCEALRDANVEVVKAFGIKEDFDFGQLVHYVNTVDYFLFDTQTAVHGGSGKTFNWNLLQRYQLQMPYFLSGGIDLNHAESISKIADTRLYAIDVNSRFELEPGLKNVNKLKQFIQILST